MDLKGACERARRRLSMLLAIDNDWKRRDRIEVEHDIQAFHELEAFLADSEKLVGQAARRRSGKARAAKGN